MDRFVPGCGNTNPNTFPRDVTNLRTMNYQNNEYKEGFLGSHQGPCEVWIDNTRVFQNDCAANFKSYPARLPVDYSKCKGTCRLTFYWLALHSQRWQAYKQCVPIRYGASRSMDPEEESYSFADIAPAAVDANVTYSA